MTITERAFSIMRERGMKASELSRITGIPRNTLSNWETRGSEMKASNVVPICDALGVSERFLLTGEDPADPGRKETAPAPVLDDRSRELLEIFGSLDDFDQGRLMERAKDLKEAASKKQERLSGSVSGSLAG